MKRYLSLFGLWTIQCVYKFVLLLLLMAAVETGLFAIQINAGLDLELALECGHIDYVCTMSFSILCAVMSVTGCQHSGRLGYTLARLRVSKWGAFLCHWLHNSIYFFLFWCAQTGIVLGLCQLHKYALGVDYGPQALLLASYRLNFFHSLLPLADWGVYVCNVLTVLALGAATAQFSALERRGKRGKAAIFMAALTMGFFRRGIGSATNGIMGTISVFVLLWCAVTGMELFKEVGYETAV